MSERLAYSLAPAGEERFRPLIPQQLGQVEVPRYPLNIAMLLSDQRPEWERRDLLTRRGLAVPQQIGELALALEAHVQGHPPRVVLKHYAATLRVHQEWLERAIGADLE